ncbi:hypothetical protein AVEN_189717-1 [Araneus ventricosus]|uniref:Uncharacterized protein n=1 Tax=Araneus ventricosus TaxID=182803 RepID=A0A4Y2J3L2_ARAVE|nr:hypothetical protein AVEN_189717-1 [Araneus ventricosus]
MNDSDMPLNSKENADMRLDEKNSDAVEAHSISSDSDANDGMSFLEEVSSRHKPEAEFSSPKTSSGNETSEVSLSEKSFSRSNSVDGLKLFNAAANKKSPTTSSIEGKYLDSSLCNKPTNLESEETYSKYSISDAFDGASLLSALPSRYKPKDGSLFQKQASFSNEITEPTSSDMPSNTNADIKFPDPPMPFSGTKGNDGLPVSLSCSSLYDDCNNNEYLNLYSENKISLNFKENLKMSSENIDSKRKTRNSESGETHSLSAIGGIFSGTLSLEEMSTDYKLGDGSLESKMPTRHQTEFLLPDNSSRPLSPNNASYNCADIASQEPATPSSIIDDNSSLSRYSSIWDYYDDDDDLERFCLQEMATLENINSEAEALKFQGSNSTASLTSSDEDCGSPTFEIMLKNAVPTENPSIRPVTSSANTSPLNRLEHDLLMQVQKFFSENPLVDETCINNVITSRYFTDEFAQEHGLTVSENEVVSIGNELEDDTATEMESREPDSYLRRLGKLLGERPFSIPMTLLKFYLRELLRVLRTQWNFKWKKLKYDYSTVEQRILAHSVGVSDHTFLTYRYSFVLVSEFSTCPNSLDVEF